MRAADLRSSPANPRRWALPEVDRSRTETVARAAIFIALGVTAGVAASINALSLAIGAIALAAVLIFAWRDRPLRVFYAALVGLLIGYAFLGRGLAHVGVPPIYVGEVVLALGVIATAISVRSLKGGPIRWMIVIFMAWGALQTIPYVSTFGIDAFRDAVSWGYAIFALMISLLITGKHFDRILGIYRTVIPFYLLWVPALLLFSRSAVAESTGEDFAILGAKPGDMGVFLAGIAAFALLGLYSSNPKPRVPEWVMWLLWLPAAATVAIYNRGGLLAILTTGAVVLFLRLPQRWLAPVFSSLLIAVVLIWVNPTMDVGQGRTLSVAQFVDNITSIVSEGDSSALEGTKEFRLAWWGKIIDYTVDGPYFWTGKGFGVNLADDDGFQVYADHSLRAPHNGHIEILARAGVPGFVLWILLNATIGISLLVAANRARILGRTKWVAIHGWLFVAWAAALVNASFDPYLQGPHGGIPFWVMIGLAIVAIEASTQPVDELSSAADPATEARSNRRFVQTRLPKPA
jgi:hypothetical protein